MSSPPKAQTLGRRKTSKAEALGEFEIIARFFAPLATSEAALGLADDVAVLQVPAGQDLIATCDTVICGVHFLANDPPDSIGHKALAVNLSDLAAKGARPFAYMLSLALPDAPKADWLEGFASGLAVLQDSAGIALVGGDTARTPGPLTVTISAFGLVPEGTAVLRKGASPGDRLFVSGTIGDAALGLRLLKEPTLAKRWGLSRDEADYLIERYRRPEPRTRLAAALRDNASAAIDVSDGLAGDIEKLCRASGAGAKLDSTRIPFSTAARKALATDARLLIELLSSGDDYEIVAAVPDGQGGEFESGAGQAGLLVSQIGRMVEGKAEALMTGPDGRLLALKAKGFAHF